MPYRLSPDRHYPQPTERREMMSERFLRWECFQANVRRVVDGDTIVIERGNLVMTIRLAHCDAPEDGQPWAVNAYQRLKDMIGGKPVSVIPIAADRYSRIVAEIMTADGHDCAFELVRDGLAYWLPGKKRREDIGEAEQEAQRAGRGIWRDKTNIRPQQFRKQKRWVTK